jgi:cytoskeletal protein RodZ
MGAANEHQVIGARLRKAREALGISQERAAQALELPRTSVSAMEAGNRKVTGAELRRLSRLYCRTVAYLLGMDEGSPTQEMAAVLNGLSEADRGHVMSFARFLESIPRVSGE